MLVPSSANPNVKTNVMAAAVEALTGVLEVIRHVTL
jgi:hypothetical protein